MRRCAFVLLGCLMISPVRAEIAVGLQGRLGGDSRAVAVSEDRGFACLGVGLRMVILGLSASGDMREIGRSEILPEIVEDILIVRDYAFVVDGRAGLYIFDISDLASPRLVSRYEAAHESIWERGFHVCLSGKYVYFADGCGGLSILDVSEPTEPVCVATLDDIYAYDVAVADGYAYVASADRGLFVLDVSDPANPKTATQLDLPHAPTYVEVSGGYAYTTGDPFELDSFQGLYVLDVRDPSNPVYAGRCDLDNPRDFVVTERFAYVTNCWAGVEFVRITNPALPARIGGYATPGFTQAIAVGEGRIYVAQEYAGLEVVDVSNLAQPAEVGTYVSTSVADVAVVDTCAYVVSAYTGLQVVDVSDPKAPRWGSWLDLNYADCVAAAKGCVWVGDGWELLAIDVSDPQHPQVASSCSIGSDLMDITMEGTLLFAAGSNGLTILDASDPFRPVVIGDCGVSANVWAVCVSGKHAYLAGVNGLNIIDISNPASPEPVGHYSDKWDWPFDVAVYGNYAYLAHGNSGMLVIDVSDPRLPGRLRALDTYFARHIVIQGRYGYLTDLRQGLRIFDASDPSTLTCLGSFADAGYERIAVVGDHLYAADMARGLAILKIEEPADSKTTIDTGPPAPRRPSEYAHGMSSEGHTIRL